MFAYHSLDWACVAGRKDFPFIFFCFMGVLISLFCSDLFCMGECRFVIILVVYLNYFISV